MDKIVIAAINSRHTHAALATATLKAYWERIDSRPELVLKEYDLNQTPESIISDLITIKPDLIAFSTYIWSLRKILEITGALKSAFPEIKVILGGPEVSYQSEKVLAENPWIDFIIRGEGEQTFEELLESLLSQNESLNNIKGLSYREKGKIQLTPDRELIESLDEIPSPFQLGIYQNGKGFTYYEASRGCPSVCSYCLSSVLGKIRNLSIERVKKDLDWFFDSDYTQVRFADRTFNFDRNRAIEIIKYILKNNYKNQNYHFEIQADFLDEEIIELFAQAPNEMFHLEIGVQSTNPNALTAVKRRFSLEDLPKKMQKLREKTKCILHLDLLGGLPFDTFEDFKKSLNQVWQWNPNCIQINLIKVLRGTPLEKEAKLGNISCSPLEPYTIYRTKWLSPEEAIRIQDVGRLVEGIKNSDRNTDTLAFIVNKLYKDDPAGFFNELASFWRMKNYLFYNFSPENIRKNLVEFFKEKDIPEKTLKLIKALLRHEYRLTQKVPAGDSNSPQNLETIKKSKLRVLPGIRTFWYETNLSEYLSSGVILSNSLYPEVYSFQKDLSAKPDNRLVALSLPERFVIASLLAKFSLDEITENWDRMNYELYSLPDFEKTIENLKQIGIIYDPKEKNYQQIKDLIEQRKF
jgi:radical SAM superfamily enzyme YgiQ (UPF0313 family)